MFPPLTTVNSSAVTFGCKFLSEYLLLIPLRIHLEVQLLGPFLRKRHSVPRQLPHVTAPTAMYEGASVPHPHQHLCSAERSLTDTWLM